MKPVLVLDLGGVLADLGSPSAAMGLEISDDEFWSLWAGSTAVAGFETGKLDYDEFIDGLVEEFPPAAKAVGDRLGDWTLTLYPGIERLLVETAERFRLALLSNTNPLHWSQLEAAHPLFARFERLFLSYETGLHKPDPEAFLQVIRYFECDPSDLAYFDDSETHVAAAGRLGVAARRVAGPTELESAIKALPGLERRRQSPDCARFVRPAAADAVDACCYWTPTRRCRGENIAIQYRGPARRDAGRPVEHGEEQDGTADRVDRERYARASALQRR